jgi:hypothetical protein
MLVAKIEIEGGGVRISVEGLPETTNEPEAWGLWMESLGSNWKDAVAIVTAAEIARQEPKRIESASAGFSADRAEPIERSLWLGEGGQKLFAPLPGKYPDPS